MIKPSTGKCRERIAVVLDIKSLSNVRIGEGADGVPSSLAFDAVAATRSGHRTVTVTRPDGKTVFLHSRFDPVQEAANRVKKFECGPLDTIIILGAGLGYEVVELCRRAGPGNNVIVIERDSGIFLEACKDRAFQALLKRPLTYFFAGAGPDVIYDFLLSGTSFFLATGIKLVSHSPSHSVFPDYYGKLLKRINDFINTGSVLLRTTMYLSRISFRNRLSNVRSYLESPGIAAYRDRFRGMPGVVVSAGPSLTKNVDRLHEIKGKAPIVAVSTALKSLLGRGIVPDFAVIIDYASLSVRYFEDIPFADRIPLVCDLKANSKAVHAYGGPKLFCDDELMNMLLGSAAEPKGSCKSGSTVAHTAYHFLCYLGCDPIIFIGQDLAYTDGELHVPGTAVYEQALGEFNRFYTPAMKELESYLIIRPRLRTVDAWHGGTVKTCDLFKTYLEEFEKFFRRRPQTIIDATEGGAVKRGTERLALKEAIARYMPEVLPRDLFEIPELDAAALDARYNASGEQFESVLKQARELNGLYRRAIKLVRRVLKENRKGKAADYYVLKVLAIKKELKEYGPLYFLLTQLAQSDLFLRQRRDRELDSGDLSGVEKQKKQAERDLDFLTGLQSALEFFLDEVKNCDFLKFFQCELKSRQDAC